MLGSSKSSFPGKRISPRSKRNEGIIHNVSSGAGLVGHPGLSGYASTKGAIEALVRSLRLELQHENVACTLMHPPLSSTRSATELGYPESLLSDPADVGRKLAGKIESTSRVITADWQTKVGLCLPQRVPTWSKRAPSGSSHLLNRYSISITPSLTDDWKIYSNC
ncbi:SDR family NAD(P)-dependent oxidoreductase [Haladaptatus halobius]|uniref:SDR family NAD(P)-dependent oxidoreductase n=1 Tax=Haladaptatus halobius TaxID=2884875 RepID=UPI001D0B23D4|nr:SDR family NAD(P)-dependent oxidoreductase [Haladaptatus halobius]